MLESNVIYVFGLLFGTLIFWVGFRGIKKRRAFMFGPNMPGSLLLVIAALALTEDFVRVVVFFVLVGAYYFFTNIGRMRTAVGVTPQLFRNALTSTLTKMNLLFEESFSLIRLPTCSAELSGSISQRSGWASLTVMQPEHEPVPRQNLIRGEKRVSSQS